MKQQRNGLKHLKISEPIGNCANCKWHDEFSWVCFNGDSPNVAGFTQQEDSCDKWELLYQLKKGKNETL